MWLKERRKSLGLSQEELAAKLQLLGMDATAAAVSHWETKRYRPPLATEHDRAIIAQALQMSISEMLYLAGYVTDTDHTPEATRAAEIIDRMTPSQRQMAVDVLERLAQG